VHDYVNHTQKEYARGDVHENRAECLFSLLKPYLRVFRGVSKFNLPGYVGFFQFLRNFRQQNAFEQAGLILEAIRKPCSNVVPVSSSFLAVMKCRVTVLRKPIQHKMYMTNLYHSGT
jgi:hypothetical protein